MFPSPAQIRAARAMLDWSLIDLSKAASVSVAVTLNAEGHNPERISEGTRGAILVAMEMAGVHFLEDDGMVRGCDCGCAEIREARGFGGGQYERGSLHLSAAEAHS